MRGRAQGTLVDLGQPEGGALRGHDDVGVADQADATAQAEAVHRCDHRHGAVVDGGERGIAAPVGPDQGRVALGGLHLLDVDAGVEPSTLGPQDEHPHRRIGAERGDHVGQLEPTGDGQSVDRRVVHDHLSDPVADGVRDRHASPLLVRPARRRSDGASDPNARELADRNRRTEGSSAQAKTESGSSRSNWPLAVHRAASSHLMRTSRFT